MYIVFQSYTSFLEQMWAVNSDELIDILDPFSVSFSIFCCGFFTG